MSQTVTPLPEPLVSTSPANQATANASGAGAAALVTILIWGLSAVHVTVPPEVAAAFTVIVGAGVHYLVVRYGLTPVMSTSNGP